ncbi:MAG: T9SS type A sorting domain-containing protein [Candidatus Fermentibacteria bacterium]
MKLLVITLLSASLLIATVYDGSTVDFDTEIEISTASGGFSPDNPDNLGYAPAPEPLDESTLADINDPTSAYEYTSPLDRAISHEDEGSSVWPEYDWDDDVEVYPGMVGSGQDWDIDLDTGDLYAIFDTDHATADSLICYRSQDGGVTWSFFGLATNSDNEIYNPKIRVVKDGSGTSWVVLMGIWQESGADQLWIRRFTTGGGSATFEKVADDVEFADLDADVSSGAWAYATYVTTGTTDVRIARNNMSGGWVDDQIIRVNNLITPYPAVAAGVGGTVAVTLLDERGAGTPQVRVRRSENYGASFASSFQISNAGCPLADTDIAFSRGSTQVGWVTVTYEFATDDNFGYYYSTDSGLSWTYGTVFSAPDSDDENLGSVRCRKDGTGSITVAFNADPGDSTMFSWTTPSSPQGFSTPERINEFNATGWWPAAAGWNGSYSGILYTNWNTNYRLMFDWWGNTGIEGTSVGLNTIQNAPNPFSATTNISFSLAQSSPVTISVYNLAGQLVSTLADNQSFDEGSHSVQWDGQHLSPGVYFCRLDADGISQTHRMLMVK